MSSDYELCAFSESSNDEDIDVLVEEEEVIEVVKSQYRPVSRRATRRRLSKRKKIK